MKAKIAFWALLTLIVALFFWDMWSRVCVRDHYEKQAVMAADSRNFSRPPTYRMQWVCDSSISRRGFDVLR